MNDRKRRVSALETQQRQQTSVGRYVFQEHGETVAEAKARQGFAPDSRVTVFTWQPPTEAKGTSHAA
jgi:hypothetical protein